MKDEREARTAQIARFFAEIAPEYPRAATYVAILFEDGIGALVVSNMEQGEIPAAVRPVIERIERGDGDRIDFPLPSSGGGLPS